MKMAKASEKDINAAGDAMSVLNNISSGYYPHRDGDECEDFRFDPDDPAHLRKFYDLMSATLDASPGWPGRVIGGMCYVVLFDANKIVDPEADTLELHPEHAANARDAERYRFLRRKIAFTGNGDGTSSMHALNLPDAQGFPEVGRQAEFIDAAIDRHMTQRADGGGVTPTEGSRDGQP